MKTFKFSEVIEFAKSVPDETPINFGYTNKNSKCGCLMVQFGIEKGIEFTSVSYEGDKFSNYNCDSKAYETSAIIEDFPNVDICEYFNIGIHIRTFGQLKKKIKQMNL